MTDLPPNPPTPTSMGASPGVTLAAFALGPSLLVRRPRRSLGLFAAAAGISAIGEVMAIRGAHVLRHHTHPQIADMPITIPLIDFCTDILTLAIGYGMFLVCRND
jgi:hypothetical protein